MGPVKVAKMRLDKLREWRQRRKQLETKERELHESIPAHMKQLVKDKQFLLLEQLADEISWPDRELHREMRNGFKLVGHGSVSKVFKEEVKPATMTEAELMSQAKFLKPLILGKIKNASAPEYCKELNDITRDEAGDRMVNGTIERNRSGPHGWQSMASRGKVCCKTTE